MEPMTLGSPSGPSIAAGNSAGYLPSFLMGDPPSTPRPNTLSPTRGRTSLAYTHGMPGIPGMPGSPTEGFRSPTMLQQSHHQNQFSSSFMLPPTPQSHQQQHGQRFLPNTTTQATSLANQYRNESFDANSSTTGPPTQGLFDSWRKQMLQTSARGPVVPDVSGQNLSFNESLQENQSGFNISRVMSPIPHSTDFNRTGNVPYSPLPTYDGGKQEQEISNWVTVFGFPQNAASVVMSHFMGVGTILEKQQALQGGNWIHLRYSSRIECNRAVNFNGRIISPGLMIGVQYCNDSTITGKENENEATDRLQRPVCRVRSLMDVSYVTNQQEAAVAASPLVQKRNNGIVNKAMDLFFGW